MDFHKEFDKYTTGLEEKVRTDQRAELQNELKNKEVRRYKNEINYNCGMTIHYENGRAFRETKLIGILGEGERIDAFFISEGKDDLQIHELRDNGLLIVYSFATHKKITMFAPTKERIVSLYASIGEDAPEFLIQKGEENMRKGYNSI